MASTSSQKRGYTTQTSNSSNSDMTSVTALEHDTEFPLSSETYYEKLLTAHQKGESEEDSLYVKIMEAAFTGSEANYLEIRTSLQLFPDLVNKFDKEQGCTPLHYASMKGHSFTVMFFLEHGANPNVWDKSPNRIKVTPLMCAAIGGHLETVRALCKHDANVNAGLDADTIPGLPPSTTATITYSSLVWASRYGRTDVVQYLLKKGASQVSAEMYSETPIHAACYHGSPEILEMLIRSKGKADLCMGSAKLTPLHIAASGNNPNGLQCSTILLDKGGVTVDPVTNKGETPLHLAAGPYYDPDIVQLLIDHGADVDARDHQQRSPLFYALNDDFFAINCIDTLVKARCNINLRDVNGYTALHVAAFLESERAVEELLMSGADYSIKDERGTSALNFLLRKIPNATTIMTKVFNSAISSRKVDNEPSHNCKVTVNYRYVVSTSDETLPKKSPYKPGKKAAGGLVKEKKKDYGTSSNLLNESQPFLKKSGTEGLAETTKIKCIIDEKQTGLLLHPLVRSFLHMKWQKARRFFVWISFFKVLLALLFSIYVLLPFMYNVPVPEPGKMDTSTATPMSMSPQSTSVPPVVDKIITPPPSRIRRNSTAIVPNPQNRSSIMGRSDPEMNPTTETPVTTTEEPEGPMIITTDGSTPSWFVTMYSVIVSLAIISFIVEIIPFIRSPRGQWISFEPFVFVAVIAIMVCYMQPETWGKATKHLHRSMAALGILLTWLDLWIYMGRFPNIGLSIRVFFKVLQNFATFLLPHGCLFIGFSLAFTLLFPKNGEFLNPFIALPKMVRIMAGDITIVSEGGGSLRETYPMLHVTHSPGGEGYKQSVAAYLLIYIYTAYVLLVPIVLMNLLIGLAVNDIQGIYKEATMHRLTKITILLNALESNLTGWWMKAWDPRKFMFKYITLFPSSQAQTRHFKPFDPRDNTLDDEMKKVFMDWDSTNRSDEPVRLEPSPTKAKRAVIENKLMKKVTELLEKVDLLMARVQAKEESDATK